MQRVNFLTNTTSDTANWLFTCCTHSIFFEHCSTRVCGSVKVYSTQPSMPMASQTIIVPPGYQNFIPTPSLHLRELEFYPFSQMSYSQQAEQPCYLPNMTSSTAIPASQFLSDLGVRSFPVQATNHQPSVIFSQPYATHSFATDVASSNYTTTSSLPVFQIASGGAVYYCNPPILVTPFSAGSCFINLFELPEYNPFADCKHSAFSANANFCVFERLSTVGSLYQKGPLSWVEIGPTLW